jgi:hypothetical protein
MMVRKVGSLEDIADEVRAKKSFIASTHGASKFRLDQGAYFMPIKFEHHSSASNTKDEVRQGAHIFSSTAMGMLKKSHCSLSIAFL